MNKRIAKKNYKRALNAIREHKPVTIINQVCVDSKGNEVKGMDTVHEGCKVLTLKRPHIRYGK